MRKLNRKLAVVLAAALLVVLGLPAGLLLVRKLTKPDAAALVRRASAATSAGKSGQAAILYKQALKAEPNCWQAHLGLGSLEEARGNLPRALEHYLAAARANPRNATLLLALGNLCERLRLWRPLEAAADRLLAIEPRNPLGHYWKALALREAGEVERATEQARQAAELDPDDPRCTVLLADLYCDGRHYEVCERFLTKRLAARPKDPKVLVALGRLYDRRGDQKRSPDKAKALYERAVSAAPQAPEPRLCLARLLVAKGQMEQAENHLSEARKHNPDHEAIRLLWCRILLAKGRAEMAQRELEEALAQNPDWLAGRALLVEALLELGQSNAARAQFEKLPDGAAGSLGLTLLEGRLLRAEGKFARAAETLCKAVERAPRSPVAHFELGLTHKALAARGEALACFEEAARLAPESPTFQRELAQAAFASERYQQALDAAQKVLARHPDDWAMLRVAGRALSAIGRHDDALKQFQRGAAKAKDPEPFLFDLAALHLALGRHYEALRALAKIPDAEKSWRVHAIRAQVYAASARRKDAEGQLLEACKLARDALPPHEMLASLYRRQGNEEKATAVLRAFADAHPGSSEAQLALAHHLRRSGNLQEALAAARRALEAEPHNLAAAHLLVGLLVRAGKAHEALEAARGAAASLPGDLRAALLVPRVLLATGKTDEALSSLGELSARYENEPAVAFLLGRAHAQHKALAAAINQFRKAVGLRPGWLAARYALATACFQARRFDEAIAECERMRRLSPGFRGARFLSAASHARKEDYAAAVAEYRAAEPEDPTPTYYLGLANLYAHSGRHEEAERALRRALQLAPDSRTVVFALVSQLDAVGKCHEAEAQLRKLPPNDPFTVALLARHYQLAGRADDAERAYARLVRLAGETPSAHILRGDFLLATARYRQAADEYRRALQLGEQTARASLARALTAAGDLEEAKAQVKALLRDKPSDARAYLEKARLLLTEATRRPRQAIMQECRSAAQKALELDPKLCEAHVVLADLDLLEEPQRRLAPLAQLKRALAIRPDYLPARLRLARIHLDLRNASEARKEARRVLAAQPRNAEALEALAAALRQDRPAASPLGVARKLAAEFPHNPARHLILGRALGEEGHWSEAVGEFRACLAEAPFHLDARFALAHALVQAGRPQEAVTGARDFAQNNNTNPAAWHLLGMALRASGQPREAARAFDQAARLAPWELRFASLAARAYHEAGDDQAAADACRTHISRWPRDPRGHILLGRTLLMAEKPEEAAGAFREALSVAPANEEALSLLVGSLARHKRLEEGIRACKAFLEAAPRSARAWHLLGRLYFLAGRLNESQMAFARAVELDPKSGPALLDLGNLFISRQRYDRAISCLEKVLALEPNHPQATNNLAWSLAETGTDLERAKRLAIRATKLAPNDPSTLDTLGWVCHKRREYPEALAALERSLALRPNSPTTLYHLALTLEATGKPNQAVQRLRAALQASEPFPERDEARRLLERLHNQRNTTQQ